MRANLKSNKISSLPEANEYDSAFDALCASRLNDMRMPRDKADIEDLLRNPQGLTPAETRLFSERLKASTQD